MIAKALVKNPWSSLATFVFVVYVMVYYAFSAHTGYLFFQHVPHRILFPATMLCYILYDEKIRRIIKRGYVAGGYLLSTSAIIWNIESGLAALGAFFAVQMVQTFSLYKFKESHFWKKAFANIAGTVLSVSGFLGGMWLIAFIRTGQSVPLRRFYAAQFTFARLGYGMLPLPKGISMYMPVFALIALGAAYVFGWLVQNAGKGNISKEINRITAICAIAVISLIYFMGRTDTRTLIPVLWPAQLLLCTFLYKFLGKDSLSALSRLEQYSIKIFAYPVCLVICLYALSMPYTIATTPVISSYIYAQRTHSVPGDWQERLDFVETYRNQRDTVNFIHASGSSIICGELGLHNTYLGECTNDLYDYDAYEYLLQYMQGVMEKREPLIIDDYSVNLLKTYVNAGYERVLSQNQYAEYDRAQDLIVLATAAD